MLYDKVLVVSDNRFLVNQFAELVKQTHGIQVKYVCSPGSSLLNEVELKVSVSEMHVKQYWQQIAENFNLVFSLHCKQIFPAELVTKVKCINVHPGFNPYNRGWFPQVFSIINGLKAGATIHEMDEQLDHGHIIAQREVVIEKWDTSFSAYNKIQLTEVELLKENIEKILNGNYLSKKTEEEGNVNLKKDFNALCKIDLKKTVTMGQAIDYLRATTHANYSNAFFVDEKTGKKVFVTIHLKPE